MEMGAEVWSTCHSGAGRTFIVKPADEIEGDLAGPDDERVLRMRIGAVNEIGAANTLDAERDEQNSDE